MRPGRAPLVLLALTALGMAVPAFAQRTAADYEQLYGKPVDVSLTDLAQNGQQYEQRAVHTSGRLDFPSNLRSRVWILRDSFGAAVSIAPLGDAGAAFEDQSRRWVGERIEVTGVVVAAGSASTSSGASNVGINFWSFLGPVERNKDALLKSDPVTLEQLVKQPGSKDGKTVRVVGKFRGRNLFGDLPGHSERQGGDWVIKEEEFAVWVSGKKPKGRGWELDPGLKRDTGKWIEVIGTPHTQNGVTYIQAAQVSLSSAPKVGGVVADVKPPPPPPPRPKVPPVVVFALPLDGDTEVPPGSTLTVQFSKDMDESTFGGHIALRYAGAVRAGDRPFDGVKLSYDGGRRALTVDPGDVMRPGRVIELLLLPGILDIDGMALVPRAHAPAPDVVDVLRYRIGG